MAPAPPSACIRGTVERVAPVPRRGSADAGARQPAPVDLPVADGVNPTGAVGSDSLVTVVAACDI